MSPDAPTVQDITSHDTYVEGVPHRDVRPHARDRAGRLDRRGRWRPRVLEPHQVRRRPLRQSPHGTVLQSPGHPTGKDMDEEETEARRTMMEMDSPEHTRLRRIVARPFTPRAVADYEERRARNSPRKVLSLICTAVRRSSTSSRTWRAELPMKMLGRLRRTPRRGPRLARESR